MDLNELNSPGTATKPWLRPQVFSLQAGAIACDGRVVQETKAGGHLSPYCLWRTLGETNVSGTTLIFAMGSFIGPVLIPAASIYAGMAVKIVASGLFTTAAASNTTTWSIRDLTGAIVYATIGMTSGTVLDRPGVVEFTLQVKTLGGPGVGVIQAHAIAQLNTAPPAANQVVASSVNNTTVDTTAGLEFYLYGQNSDAGSVFARRVAYAIVEA